MKTKLAISLLIVISLLLMGSVWKMPGATEIFWYVLGGGGGQLASGSVILEGTLGQPVAGVVSQAVSYRLSAIPLARSQRGSQSPREVCSGYWCGADVSSYKLYLPIARRQ